MNDDHLHPECLYSMLFDDTSLCFLLMFEHVKLANGEEHILVGSLDMNQGLQVVGALQENQPNVTGCD
jgi:hypothetical protein